VNLGLRVILLEKGKKKAWGRRKKCGRKRGECLVYLARSVRKFGKKIRGWGTAGAMDKNRHLRVKVQ